jgi:hypothetical protein
MRASPNSSTCTHNNNTYMPALFDTSSSKQMIGQAYLGSGLSAKTQTQSGGPLAASNIHKHVNGDVNGSSPYANGSSSNSSNKRNVDQRPLSSTITRSRDAAENVARRPASAFAQLQTQTQTRNHASGEYMYPVEAWHMKAHSHKEGYTSTKSASPPGSRTNGAHVHTEALKNHVHAESLKTSVMTTHGRAEKRGPVTPKKGPVTPGREEGERGQVNMRPGRASGNVPGMHSTVIRAGERRDVGRGEGLLREGQEEDDGDGDDDGGRRLDRRGDGDDDGGRQLDRRGGGNDDGGRRLDRRGDGNDDFLLHAPRHVDRVAARAHSQDAYHESESGFRGDRPSHKVNSGVVKDVASSAGRAHMHEGVHDDDDDDEEEDDDQYEVHDSSSSSSAAFGDTQNRRPGRAARIKGTVHASRASTTHGVADNDNHQYSDEDVTAGKTVSRPLSHLTSSSKPPLSNGHAHEKFDQLDRRGRGGAGKGLATSGETMQGQDRFDGGEGRNDTGMRGTRVNVNDRNRRDEEYDRFDGGGDMSGGGTGGRGIDTRRGTQQGYERHTRGGDVSGVNVGYDIRQEENGQEEENDDDDDCDWSDVDVAPHINMHGHDRDVDSGIHAANQAPSSW